MTVENINNHMAYKCECGCVHFNLLRSNAIECADCQKVFGRWNENTKPVAKVINNNQPGWENIVETEPHVTLDIGTELFTC